MRKRGIENCRAEKSIVEQIRTSVIRVFAKNRIKIAPFLKKSKMAAIKRLRDFLNICKMLIFKDKDLRFKSSIPDYKTYL